MHTITLRDLITHEACTHGAIRYCDYLGITHIEGLDELRALDDDVLDTERLLVDYLSRSTLIDVIWATRCLVDWREVVVKFARGCADAAGRYVAAANKVAAAAKAAADEAAANDADDADEAASNAAGEADDAKAAAGEADDAKAAAAAADAAAATAADAAAAANEAADAAAAAGSLAGIYEIERMRQVEHLRALLS